MTVFAIDDEALALDALTDGIKKAAPNANTMSFMSPQKALSAMEKESCDIAFIDIEMPEMNGIELAKKMKLINPKLNIIFETGYSQYAVTAAQMHCSGYLMKPITPEKIKRELEDLRHPIERTNEKRIRVQTFGNFEVFIDENPVTFKYAKTKEYLAYLVDRGTQVSNGEIISVIFEKDASQSWLRLIRKDLTDTFKAQGIGDVIIRSRNMQGIRQEMISCDYYDWQMGLPDAINAYKGEYMSQYSWAEFTKGGIK